MSEPEVPLYIDQGWIKILIETDIDGNIYGARGAHIMKALVCLSDGDILDEGNMAPPEPEVPIYRERDIYRYE